jgi:alpha-beta hydrolase superfamily lysophospholipase
MASISASTRGGSLRRVLAVVAVAVGTMFAVATPAHGAPVGADPAADCRSADLTVDLVPLLVTHQRLHVTLCRPVESPARALQVLVHGGTYDSWYWDPTYQPDQYSYVRYMIRRGYATLNIDRLGEPASSQPAPELLTIQNDAYVLHQAIAAARAGAIDGVAYDDVVLVSHSIGSAVAVNEMATWPKDVDSAVVTGLTHVPSENAPSVILSLYPAVLDPTFAGQSLPPGYLTSEPGVRGTDFYGADDADPGTVAADEATKAFIFDGEVATFFPSLVASVGVRVPVMLAVGQFDHVFCPAVLPCDSGAAVVARERLFDPAAPSLDAFVLPGAGHDINLALDNREWFAAAATWIDAHTRR